ncbi:outer membrane beta-barrel protein [Helicobacter sp. T3_23-1059]
MSNLTRNSLSPFTGLRNIAKGVRLISLAGVASMAFSPLYADIEGGGETKIGGGKHNGLFFGVEAGVSAGLGKKTNIVREPTADSTKTTTTTTKNDAFPLGAVGLKFGYTHFFNRWAGLRGYATYHYVYNYTYNKTDTDTRTINATTGQLVNAENNPTQSVTSTAKLSSYHQVAANIEAVFKFANIGNNSAIGGFIGLGAGYADSYARVNTQPTTGAGTIITTQEPSGFVLPVNVGLEVYVGRHHNASLAFRLPTIAIDYLTTPTALTTNTDELRQLIITAGYYYKF